MSIVGGCIDLRREEMEGHTTTVGIIEEFIKKIIPFNVILWVFFWL